MTDLVSIIIPVYNAENTIERCVNSALDQTYKNIQVVLIDDGSTDCSLRICKKLAEKDWRIVLHSKKNGGVSSARNMGIKLSTGKYIMFLDSDDWLEKDMVGQYLEDINKSNADIVIGGLNTFSQKDIELPHLILQNTGNKDICLWEHICCDSTMFGYSTGKMFKKVIIDTYKIRFNEKMYSQEDLDFCLSYYDKISDFYLTDYIGYQYYCESGKRIPPYCDFIRNQLKLKNIAESKCKLSTEAYKNIQNRICGYVYMMFYQADTKEKAAAALADMKAIAGLDDYLLHCRVSRKMKYIVSRYLKSDYKGIYRFFYARNYIKKLLKRK